jgi:uroporphyrinogen III methyltransferase/synthase
VYLIGGGPGDPGLLTVKGRACLEQADVVIYDTLVNDRLLEHTRPTAERVPVEEGGRHLRQAAINRLMIDHARRGRMVVRLKGGDPFIFGRGGEEAEALVAAGVAFEVVPGVTAATAVPAYAGIPLTHREMASSVGFVTGHEDPTKPGTMVRWEQLAAGPDTLVLFMGMSRLPDIVDRLVKHGRPPGTPVAVVRWGTRLEQQTVTGTLENILDRVRETTMRSPVIIVVGEVVRLRERLNWYENRPLFGKRILVTRAREQANEFVSLLEHYGAEVVEFPTIEIVPPESWDEMDRAIERLPQYHWIIFTSVNGVKFFIERLRAVGRDIRALHGIRLCTIGPRTAQEVEQYGVRVDFMPDEYVAEAVIEGMGRQDLKGKRILIPRAAVAREVLPEDLRKMGAAVDVVTAYRTVLPTQDLDRLKTLLQEGAISVITFTSSSTVNNFAKLLGTDETVRLLRNTVVASIGPITAETARSLGIESGILPTASTIPALAEAIVEHFGKPPTAR